MPTALGLVVLPLSLLWAGRPDRLLQVVLIASVFEAGSAFVLGGFGVPVAMVPALVLLAHVVAQYLFGMRYPGDAAALRALMPLLLLLAYAVGATLLLPEAFAGRIMVFPQKADPMGQGSPVPLEPGTGNLTQSAYLLINVLLACAAAVVLTRAEAAWKGLLGAYLASGYLVVAISIWNFGSRVGGLPFPSDIFYSNPGWTIVEQSMGSIPRIQGPFPEPSALATYMSGVACCCLLLLVRGHTAAKPHVLLGLAILTTLLSTSTTGIAALVIGLPALLFHAMRRVDAARRRRAVLTLGLLLVFASGALGPVVAMQPELLDLVGTVLDDTLSKSDSGSFAERQQWNSVAWDAVVATWGLGIGWGSTRASSLLPGLLAGAGVFGLVMAVWLAYRVRRLARRAEGAPGHPAHAVVDGLSGALCGQLLAASLSAPTVTSAAFFLQLGAVVAGAIRISAESAAVERRPM